MKKESLLCKNYFKKKHGIEIDDKSLATGWEGVIYYHEELEDSFIPQELLHTLPDPLLCYLIVHDDEEGQEWIFILVADSDESTKWFSAYCMRNGDVIDSDIRFLDYL